MADTQLDKLKIRIPYDEKIFGDNTKYENKLKELLEDSMNIALSNLYPFLEDFEGVELPKKYYNWQIRAAVELNKWKGTEGAKAYAENGLSWSKDNDGALSNTLLEELVPCVGVPKKKESKE